MILGDLGLTVGLAAPIEDLRIAQIDGDNRCRVKTSGVEERLDVGLAADRDISAGVAIRRMRDSVRNRCKQLDDIADRCLADEQVVGVVGVLVDLEFGSGQRIGLTEHRVGGGDAEADDPRAPNDISVVDQREGPVRSDDDVGVVRVVVDGLLRQSNQLGECCFGERRQGLGCPVMRWSSEVSALQHVPAVEPFGSCVLETGERFVGGSNHGSDRATVVR